MTPTLAPVPAAGERQRTILRVRQGPPFVASGTIKPVIVTERNFGKGQLTIVKRKMTGTMMMVMTTEAAEVPVAEVPVAEVPVAEVPVAEVEADPVVADPVEVDPVEVDPVEADPVEVNPEVSRPIRTMTEYPMTKMMTLAMV
jgi:hypothetical protein